MQAVSSPQVSIITPTHNRSRSLRRMLDALQRQTFPLAQVEVIVVADGCSDDTVAMVQSYTAPYRLTVIDQASQGAAGARNTGARAATAPLLLFLDDDIEPLPDLVAAHVAVQAQLPVAGVTLGPYPPLPQATTSFFRLQMRSWWEQKFRTMAEPGHRFTYQDLLTGNLGIPATLWHRMGGLDPSFRESGNEDYEFGMRLIQAGVPFHFVPEALVYHYEHETATLASALRRAFNEGRSDVIMGRKHPAIRNQLAIVRWRQYSYRRQRALARWLYAPRSQSEQLARQLQRFLLPLERFGLRKEWQKLFYHLRLYWYLRGGVLELGSRQVWAAYAWEVRPSAETPATLRLDVQQGWAEAEALLDAERPERVLVYYGAERITTLPAAVGAERWRGVHLRPFLFRHAGPALLRTLAIEGVIDPAPLSQRFHIARAIEEHVRPFFGPEGLNLMWLEHYTQWERLEREVQSEVQ